MGRSLQHVPMGQHVQHFLMGPVPSAFSDGSVPSMSSEGPAPLLCSDGLACPESPYWLVTPESQSVSKNIIIQRSICVDGLCRSGSTDEPDGSCMASGVWSILYDLRIFGLSLLLRQSFTFWSCRPTKFPVVSSPLAVRWQRHSELVLIWLRRSRVGSIGTVSCVVLRHLLAPISSTIQRFSVSSARGWSCLIEALVVALGTDIFSVFSVAFFKSVTNSTFLCVSDCFLARGCWFFFQAFRRWPFPLASTDVFWSGFSFLGASSAAC